jgi:hypothetical protein
MICTDTGRKTLRYKDQDGKDMKDQGGKVVIPYMYGCGQSAIEKAYNEAEKIIKERTNTESEYKMQMKWLDDEWRSKYSKIRMGISDKEVIRAAGILASGTHMKR